MNENITADSNSLRILVVDDNEALATTLGLLLELTGALVCVRHNGREGLAAVDSFQPHIVFLDIGMPVMDGLQVCETLRSSTKWSHLRIIAQTGYGDQAMVARCRAAGFDRHILKPVEFDIIQEEIDWFRRNQHFITSNL